MYPVQSILPTTVILHNPQANLLSRDCKTLLNSEYIAEEKVLGILAQSILKKIEQSIFYNFS